MTTFLTSFLNNLPQLQNKIAIKKNFVHLIQHYRWFNSLSLLPFVSKILTQHKSYRTFVKNQSVVPQHVSVNLPFLHRAFVFTHVCTTRFNTNNRFKINKQFSSNKTAIAQVKNVQKLSTRTRRLALALQQFSRTSANLLLNSTFQTRFSFTLAPGRSKRLNLLVDPSTQLLVPNARPITQSISLKMVELFISAQSHTSRKYKHNTFIKKYIYLRSCYSKTHPSFNLQSRFKQLDWFKVSPTTTQPTTCLTKSKRRFYLQLLKNPCSYVVPTLSTFNSYSNVHLPKLEYFTRAQKNVLTVELHQQKNLLTYIPKIADVSIENRVQTLPSTTRSSFKIGLTFPFFLNISIKSEDLTRTTPLFTIINSYVSCSSFVTTLTTKRFLTLLTQQRKLLTLHTNNLLSSNVASQTSLTVYSHRFTNVNSKPQLATSRLTHIRFKPGYARQWRDFRRDFRDFFFLKKRYQYRLTRYLTHITITQRKCRLLRSGLLLDKVLVYAKLVVDRSTAHSYISTGTTFLNGSQIINSGAQVLPNDFIQLTIFLKYYMVHKLQQNQILQQRRALGRLLWQRGKNWTKNRCNFPNWAKKLETTFFDVPLTLEVDYFSSSCYVLNFDNTNTFYNDNYPNVLPLYNWKYIV